jgi:hypothetical protein
VRTAESKCGHWPLNCAAECAKVPGFRAAWHLPPPPPVEDISVPFCIGWRNTAGCTPDGPREPHLDATCYTEVPKRRSGYVCARAPVARVFFWR